MAQMDQSYRRELKSPPAWTEAFARKDPLIWQKYGELCGAKLTCRECETPVTWRLHCELAAVVSACCKWCAHLPVAPGTPSWKEKIATDLVDLLIDPSV